MEYLVIGPDGKEYGPANIDTLKAWIVDGRVGPNTQLKDFTTGQVSNASAIAGLFPNAPPASPVASDYSNPYAAYPTAGAKSQDSSDNGVLIGVIVRSVLGIALFFVLHGIGLFFAGYALYYAIQAKSNGNRHGTTAIIIASLAVATVGIGWILRLNGANV